MLLWFKLHIDSAANINICVAFSFRLEFRYYKNTVCFTCDIGLNKRSIISYTRGLKIDFKASMRNDWIDYEWQNNKQLDIYKWHGVTDRKSARVAWPCEESKHSREFRLDITFLNITVLVGV